MAPQTRLVIIVNKSWECDPVCWTLTNRYLSDTCGIVVPWPVLQTWPCYGPVPPIHHPVRPRMVWYAPNLSIELWCVSDLLSRYPTSPNFQSSSERKMDVLGEIFSYSYDPVELVVAVGTASTGPDCPPYHGDAQDNINGSVVVGGRVFLHDGHPESDPNPFSRWRWPFFDSVMSTSLSDSVFRALAAANTVEDAFLCPPTNLAPNGPHLYCDSGFVAVGDINVTDYSEYSAKDAEAGAAYEAADGGNGVSLETTHGLIYAAAREAFAGIDPPFLFISGVVDRFTMFKTDVVMPYAQNVAGAHNAGIVVAQLIADRLRG